MHSSGSDRYSVVPEYDVASKRQKPRYPRLRYTLEGAGFIVLVALGMLAGGLLGGMLFPGLGIGFGMLAGLGVGATLGVDFIGLSNLWFAGKRGKISGALAVTISSAGIGAGMGALSGTMVFPGIGTAFGALMGATAGLITGITLTGIAQMVRELSRYERFKGFVIASSATTIAGALTGALLAGALFGVGVIPAMVAGGVVGFAALGALKLGVDIYRHFTVKNEPIILYPLNESKDDGHSLDNNGKQFSSLKNNGFSGTLTSSKDNDSTRGNDNFYSDEDDRQLYKKEILRNSNREPFNRYNLSISSDINTTASEQIDAGFKINEHLSRTTSYQ